MHIIIIIIIIIIIEIYQHLSVSRSNFDSKEQSESSYG